MQGSKRRQPVIFFGHGTPLNAIEDNIYTRAWERIGAGLDKPAAILCVSAHWWTDGTYVTAMEQPPTIYDFGYQNMFHVKYPAPGSPALARRVAQLLAPVRVGGDLSWGFDHGTWSVLVKALPKADIPVVQLSVNGRQPPAFHLDLGRKLRALREENVLVVASGNIVHNLALTIRHGVAKPYPWAERFDAIVRDKLLERDFDALARYDQLDREALMAVPTPDHYLPLLYAAGASDEADAIAFPVEGIDRGTMSMRSVTFGLDGV